MNKYLNDEQKINLNHYKKSIHYQSEWLTWMVIFAIYIGWFSVLLLWKTLGIYLSSLLLIVFNCWYMSLQHELLHGHPTRFNGINRLLGIFPLSIWYPYDLYKDQHLIHHSDQQLTDPILDPESNYILIEDWKYLSRFQKMYYWSNRTAFGRFLLGPLYSIWHTFKHIYTSFKKCDYSAMIMWIEHLLLLSTLIYLLVYLFYFPIWLYIIITYFSLSLALLRSLYEHRPADQSEHRSVINEAEWFFRILFLDNNYHLVHHDLPHIPWFMLKKVFKAHQTEYIKRSRYFYYQGYRQVFKSHYIQPIDSPIYQHTSAQLHAKITANHDHEQ